MILSKRRGKPRRGRVIDESFMDFARQQGCILRRWTMHVCEGPMTFHHDRKNGSPKDDTHGVGLCARAHLIGWNSRTSIEALGKRKFEQYWKVNLEEEIARLRAAYQESK